MNKKSIKLSFRSKEENKRIVISKLDAERDFINYWDLAKNKDFSKYWRLLKKRKKKSSVEQPLRKNYDYGVDFVNRLKWFNDKKKREEEIKMISTASTLPKLVFMVGIPGSGKSKFIKETTDENTIVVCPDQIRKELTGDVSNQTKNGEVWDLAKRRAAEALKNGKDVILDATNVSSSRRKGFSQGLPPHKLFAKLFYCDPEVSYQRIRKQIENGEERANVPHGAIVRMHEQFEKESKPEQLIGEGFELL